MQWAYKLPFFVPVIVIVVVANEVWNLANWFQLVFGTKMRQNMNATAINQFLPTTTNIVPVYEK